VVLSPGPGRPADFGMSKTLATLDYPMHGKQSALAQQEGWLFEGLPAGIRVGRYHRQLPIFAVQFHPESILTLQSDAGRLLLANVLQTLAGQA